MITLEQFVLRTGACFGYSVEEALRLGSFEIDAETLWQINAHYAKAYFCEGYCVSYGSTVGGDGFGGYGAYGNGYQDGDGDGGDTAYGESQREGDGFGGGLVFGCSSGEGEGDGIAYGSPIFIGKGNGYGKGYAYGKGSNNGSGTGLSHLHQTEQSSVHNLLYDLEAEE